MIYIPAKCPRQSVSCKSEAKGETFERLGVDDMKTYYYNLAYLLKPLRGDVDPGLFRVSLAFAKKPCLWPKRRFWERVLECEIRSDTS